DELLAGGCVRIGLAHRRQVDERHLLYLSPLPGAVQRRLPHAQHPPQVAVAEALLGQPAHESLLLGHRAGAHRLPAPELAPQRDRALLGVPAREGMPMLEPVPREHVGQGDLVRGGVPDLDAGEDQLSGSLPGFPKVCSACTAPLLLATLPPLEIPAGRAGAGDEGELVGDAVAGHSWASRKARRWCSVYRGDSPILIQPIRPRRRQRRRVSSATPRYSAASASVNSRGRDSAALTARPPPAQRGPP